MGNHITVFRHGQQFIATAGARFCGRHFTRQRGKALNVQADGLQHDINRFQELIAMEVFQTSQIDAGATFIDLVAQAVETFSSSSGKFTAGVRRRRSYYLRL